MTKKKIVIAVVLVLIICIPFCTLAHEYFCSGCSIPVKKLGTFEATAYCSCAECCGKTDGITASGAAAERGTVAVDPSIIPLGSVVYVEFEDGSIKECIAQDTGGAIKGKRIDIYYESHNDTVNFGRQNVTVYIEK